MTEFPDFAAWCIEMHCPYYYQDEDETYPRCHYDDPYYLAPCEQSDI